MNNIELTAKLSTRCSCGRKIKIGSQILWNKESKETVGCEKCNFTGDPPESDGDNTDPLDDFGYDEYLLTRDWA